MYRPDDISLSRAAASPLQPAVFVRLASWLGLRRWPARPAPTRCLYKEGTAAAAGGERGQEGEGEEAGRAAYKEGREEGDDDAPRDAVTSGVCE